MEENLDSIKKINNQDEVLKNSSSIENNEIGGDLNNKNIIASTKSENKIGNKLEKSDNSESANISKLKPKKEIPIEKKPFIEFVNGHLFPSLIDEFKDRGYEVKDINLKNTSRPIAGDKCWVIYCEIKDICNFWLSFEKDDISSLKSISLCKSNQKPSIIESFLIDEKRITLKLIISRIFQRLNGQKLLGDN